MTFQASDLKGKQFLDLLDGDDNIIEPSYIKGGSWLKYFSHSNSLCVQAIRDITNHALIGEYRLRFFPREEFLSSRYIVSYFYIPKKDKSLQLVQDYQKLNQYMIKNKTLLPLIREVIDKLKEAKYFNKLNLIWDYNNIQIKEEDKWKIASLINEELFKPKFMYFRLYNLPEIKCPCRLYPIESR